MLCGNIKVPMRILSVKQVTSNTQWAWGQVVVHIMVPDMDYTGGLHTTSHQRLGKNGRVWFSNPSFFWGQKKWEVSEKATSPQDPFQTLVKVGNNSLLQSQSDAELQGAIRIRKHLMTTQSQIMKNNLPRFKYNVRHLSISVCTCLASRMHSRFSISH